MLLRIPLYHLINLLLRLPYPRGPHISKILLFLKQVHQHPRTVHIHILLFHKFISLFPLKHSHARSPPHRGRKLTSQGLSEPGTLFPLLPLDPELSLFLPLLLPIPTSSELILDIAGAIDAGTTILFPKLSNFGGSGRMLALERRRISRGERFLEALRREVAAGGSWNLGSAEVQVIVGSGKGEWRWKWKGRWGCEDVRSC